jgi:Xaa-Pro aminopeptidase
MDMKSDSAAKLFTLRRLMVERGIDVYIIPSEDSHHSEYTAPCDARREYLTGFTGSAGCAVVTADAAILATDGRYFAQATTQLDSNWKLLKQGHPDIPTWQDWAAQQSFGGKNVAVDPSLITANAAASLSAKIKRSGGVGLTPLYENLIDKVWGIFRPERPSLPVTVHLDRFAGCTVQNKLTAVREILANKSADVLVLSTLDDIAWLFNIRGADIPFNPVFFSYAIVAPSYATIYVEFPKLTTECVQHLSQNQVGVRPYGAVFDDLQKISDSIVSDVAGNAAEAASHKIMLSHKSSWALTLSIGRDDKITEVRSPVSDLKAIKNAIEVNGMRACHLRDSAAMVQYFAWLEHELVNKSTALTETQAADKLEEFRSKQDMFVGLSFATVSATGANAAIIHYQPSRTDCSIIDPEAVYLCDSGGQYLDGTTDTTRTIHHGNPTNDEKRAYTLVLKGNIALDSAVFPKGTCGFALDCLARQFLRVSIHGMAMHGHTLYS